MSEQHARRLRQVFLEKEAAQEALNRRVEHASNSPTFYDADLEDLRRAAINADMTYYIRLTAELEGMLFRHLKDHHPSVALEGKEGAALLLSHCRHRLSPNKKKIPKDLEDEVMKAIRWRNYLVHGEKSTPPDRVSFDEAYGSIHDLLVLLPNMKGDHT